MGHTPGMWVSRGHEEVRKKGLKRDKVNESKDGLNRFNSYVLLKTGIKVVLLD